MVVVVGGRVLILSLLTIHSNELERRQVLGTCGWELGPAGQLVLVEESRWDLHDLWAGGVGERLQGSEVNSRGSESGDSR